MDARQRTALVSVAAATLLVLMKLAVGISAGSIGLISAAVESSGDVVAALVTLGAVRLAQRPADPEHRYGHERVENLSALGEAAILVGGGAFILTEATQRLAGGGHGPDTAWYVFAVIGAAVGIDLSRVVVSLRSARVYRSAAFMSNAYHFAGDLVGSLAVLIGLAAVSAGFERGDAVAALAVSLIIFGGAVRLIWQNSNVLMDSAPSGAYDDARRAIEAVDHPLELRRLRMRASGSRHFVDAVVAVPPATATGQGHAVADAVEQAVEEVLPGSDVVVHVEPGEAADDPVERVLAAAYTVPRVREAHNVRVIDIGNGLAVSLHVKLPGHLTLDAADRSAAEVERAIRARLPRVAVVQTHLEPIEPIRRGDVATPPVPELQRFEAAIRGATDTAPESLRVIEVGGRLVVFATVVLDPSTTLGDAHALASDAEEALRRVSDVADVVVRTTGVG